MQLKEKFTNSLSEILWFETELDNDNVKIKQWLDFWSYKINNWFRNDFEELLDKSLKKTETLWKEEDKEKIYKYILDFFALYYKWWDFGYFKSRFDSFKYRIPYSWKDTEFTWSTKDSYFVKTKDVENKIKVWMLDTEIEFIKQDNEDKQDNKIEVIREEDKIKVVFYNWKTNKKWQWKSISNDELKTLKKLLKEETGIELQIDDKEKQLLNDFLKKWWKDYFIHKNLKGFLQEELSYFVYQKIWLEEYIFIKKQSILNLVNEILDLQDKEVLDTKQEEVEKLFNEIQDTDDIYRYYENLQKIEKIVSLSQNSEWEKIKLNKFLDFQRFKKLKNDLETKLDNLKTILDWNVKDNIKVFNEIMNSFIDKLSEIEEIKKLIWTTKRNVLKSDYVVSIDRILQAGWSKEFILDLITEEQIKEWKNELKLVDENFKKNEDIFENEKYKFLPIDTKYLDEETKFKLLSLFDNIEEKLDWLLIKSENFQALNTLLEKYKEQVKTIYIDPPYNTWNDGFVYKDNYNHSSWLSMMENRLNLAKEWMREDWVIFTSIWKDEFLNQEKLFENIFVKDLHLTIKKKPNYTMGDQWISNITDFISVWYKKEFTKKGKNIKPIYKDKNWMFVLRNLILRTDMMYTWMKNTTENFNEYIYLIEFDFDCDKEDKLANKNKKLCKVKLWNKIKYKVPKKRRFMLKKEELYDLIKKWNIYYDWKELYFKEYNPDYISKYAFSKVLTKDLLDNKFFYNQYWTKSVLEIFWYDIKWTPKPIELIKFLINTFSDGANSIILDFFAWSWTTADAVIRLNQEDWWNRKFILTELNHYFDTIIIPRIKKVSFWSEWKIWKPDFSNKDWKQSWIFFKYSYLDQYENILENLDLSQNFETFQEKLIYIYNQILIEKLKDNDFINTAIYQLWLKEIKYILTDQAVILETDQINIVKPLKDKITELNTNNGKDTYILQQDYDKLSDNLKTKTKILETLFLLN